MRLFHRFHWTWLAATIAAAAVGAACSAGSKDAVVPAASTAAATASGTSAPSPAAPSPTAAATAAAKAAPALSTPGTDGTVHATISGGRLPTLAVKSGTVVVFVNEDALAHTATSDDGSTFDSQSLSPGGGSFKFTASKAGTFSYVCSIHPDMKGTLTVQ